MGYAGIAQGALKELGTGKVMPLVRDWQRSAFHMLGMLDMGSALPTWIGAYHKGMAEGMGADKVVRNAHGGGRIMDMAEVMRGNEFWKATTMFMAFWNHFLNRQIDLGRRLGKVAKGEATGADLAAIVQSARLAHSGGNP